MLAVSFSSFKYFSANVSALSSALAEATISFTYILDPNLFAMSVSRLATIAAGLFLN